MTRTNIKTEVDLKTHEGGKAIQQKPELELARTVATTMLFENTYYESGQDIAKRIEGLCKEVSAQTISDLAVKARDQWYLRHVPLFLAIQLTRLHSGAVVGNTIERVIKRADEMGEFLFQFYGGPDRKKSSQKLDNQARDGLARAFTKFDAYQLAKYDSEADAWKMRDVLFLVHPKPGTPEQAAMWKQLVDKTLPIPRTWETELSAGKDKKETFEGLLRDQKIGTLALLRNLRNMIDAGVDRLLIINALKEGRKWGIFPSQFLAAARYAPAFAQEISDEMLESLKLQEKLPGGTLIVVDVSGSMNHSLSEKSRMSRMDAAATLAVHFREICEYARVVTFSNEMKEVSNVRGLGLVEGIVHSQSHGGTYLGRALSALQKNVPQIDRVIVITDEQAHDGLIPNWAKNAYVINVAPYAFALNTHLGWTRINGFSDRVVDWVRVEEKEFRS